MKRVSSLHRVAAVLSWLVLSMGLPIAAGAAPSSPAFKAGVFEPPRQAPEFVLSGSDGAELKLGRYRGKVVLLSFGFSQCAAVCPTTLATLAQVRKALGADADTVQVIYVTVDPERDTVPVMKAYMAAFDPSFIGATGRPQAMAAMRKDYGVVADKVPTGAGYVFNHSASVFLIDREGKLRAMMPFGHEAKDFVHDVQLLLAK